MASLQSAFNGISPYQQTQIWTSQQLLHLGYQSFLPSTTAEAGLCNTLLQTVETIKRFVWDRFQLVGIDNQGSLPPFFIHLKDKNAYYHPPLSGSEYFAFHDSFVNHPEVVAHEFTHGIIQHLNPLGNQGEAGAINESIADVVGIVFKRHTVGIKDWSIGGLRDLSSSFTVKNLLPTSAARDNGNTHNNSRLLSHAFYRVSKKLEGYDAGDKQLLNIWLTAIKELGSGEKTFVGFAKKTIQIGFEKSGLPFSNAIEKAWKEIGLLADTSLDKKDQPKPSSKLQSSARFLIL